MNFYKIREIRLKQLEKEEKNDNLLKKSFEICPDNVVDFLFASRLSNRNFSKDIYSSSMFSGKAETYLELIENFNNTYDIECPIILCNFLPEMTKEISTKKLNL